MAELKVNEIYSSIQGEGPNTGVATTFIRFGGCNLRCPGWGYGERADGTEIAGCDTVHAVDPSWRHTWLKMHAHEIADQCEDTDMVTFTGGEPLIQHSDKLEELGTLLASRGHTLEMFTNGTKPIPFWFLLLKSYLVVDFKLEGSGEYGKFDNLNLNKLRVQDTIKFVCKNQEDIDQAVKHMAVFQNHTDAQFSMGVVWDSPELSEAQLAELLSTDLAEVSLNIQLHKHIWSPDERRR